MLWTAVSASASAPIYFDPKSNKNQFEIEELLIDGGLICNNPSLYAFQMAKHLNGYENIRLISLGTGESASQTQSLNNTDSFTKIDSILSLAN